MSTKSPDQRDKHLGGRVRMRRMMLGMSQEKLGDEMGLTFQQIQKYEKGANRIAATKVPQLAAILKCPIGFFFEDMPGIDPATLVTEPDAVTRTMATRSGAALARAFDGIKDDHMRAVTVSVVETLAATHHKFAGASA